VHSEYGAALRSVPNSDMHTTSRQSNADSIAVLGIDAAWTAHNPSGVSLWRRDQGRWAAYVSVLATLPSAALRAAALTTEQMSPRYSQPVASCLETAATSSCRRYAIANSPITGRRAADNAVSREFGASIVPLIAPVQRGRRGFECAHQGIWRERLPSGI